MKAATMLQEAERMYEDAIQEIKEKTGREYRGMDVTFGCNMTDAKDNIAYFIGEAMMNETISSADR